MTEKSRKRASNDAGERTQISVRLSNELLDKLQRLAEREQRNRSNMIEYLLREIMRGAAEK